MMMYHRIVFDHIESALNATAFWTAQPKSPEAEALEARQRERESMARILQIAHVTLEGESESPSTTETEFSSSSSSYSIDSDDEDNYILKLFNPEKDDQVETRVLHITHLVGPYDILELHGLLSQTGTFDADRFWINPIGSHCYVTFETVEQAQKTRQALHKRRWPLFSPKVLLVHYSSEKELNRLLRPLKRTQNNLYSRIRWTDPVD